MYRKVFCAKVRHHPDGQAPSEPALLQWVRQNRFLYFLSSYLAALPLAKRSYDPAFLIATAEMNSRCFLHHSERSWFGFRFPATRAYVLPSTKTRRLDPVAGPRFLNS